MDTFVDLSWYFSALHRSLGQSRADRPRDGAQMAAGRSIYRRHRARDLAPALCALLHPRHAADGHADELKEPFAGLFTQGMVVHETYRDAGRRLGRSPEIRSGRRPRTPRDAARAGRRLRSARSRKCRSRNAIRSTPTRSSRPMAPIRRAGSSSPIRRPRAM